MGSNKDIWKKSSIIIKKAIVINIEVMTTHMGINISMVILTGANLMEGTSMGLTAGMVMVMGILTVSITNSC